jgi:hypothetical protein
MEGRMSKVGLDNRHRDKDGEIGHKHGDTHILTLCKVHGQSFAAGYPEADKLAGSASIERNVAEPAPPRS